MSTASASLKGQGQGRPRRRGARGLITLAIVVIVLIVAYFVADNLVRSAAVSQIENQVRTAASLPASTAVVASVGGASVLLQLAEGRLSDVHVKVDGLSVGALNGDAQVAATGVPTDSTQPISTASLQFTVDQAQLKTLLAGYASLSKIKVSSVAVSGGAVQVGTQFAILGIELPVAVALAPSAVDGELALTPKSLTIGGRTMTAPEVRTNFASIAPAVLAVQKICIAKYLPKSLTLQSVVVRGSSVQLTVAGKQLVLDDSLLTTKGVCK